MQLFVRSRSSHGALTRTRELLVRMCEGHQLYYRYILTDQFGALYLHFPQQCLVGSIPDDVVGIFH